MKTNISAVIAVCISLLELNMYHKLRHLSSGHLPDHLIGYETGRKVNTWVQAMAKPYSNVMTS